MLVPPSASLRTRTAAFLEDEQLALDQDCELEHRRTGPELDHRGGFVVEGPETLRVRSRQPISVVLEREDLSASRGPREVPPLNMGPSSRT